MLYKCTFLKSPAKSDNKNNLPNVHSHAFVLFLQLCTTVHEQEQRNCPVGQIRFRDGS